MRARCRFLLAANLASKALASLKNLMEMSACSRAVLAAPVHFRSAVERCEASVTMHGRAAASAARMSSASDSAASGGTPAKASIWCR